MTDPVDAGMLAQQVPSPQSQRDFVAGHPGSEQLLTGHDTVGSAGYHSQVFFDRPIWGCHMRP
jgi:hypothetical protein